MAILADIDHGRIIYTCHCGWIDTGHANPQHTARPYVGAVKLWEQTRSEQGQRSRNPFFNGFRVTYVQDALRTVFGARFYPGVEKSYFVKYSLPIQTKKEIALAIFMEVSHAFESLQSKTALITRSDSGYSVEDLVSNLVSFYSEVMPGVDYMKLCEPVSKEASKKVWQQFGPVGSIKNKSFQPIFFDCDECNSKGPFPKQLQLIRPANKGEDFFEDWGALYECEKMVCHSPRRMR